VKKEWKDSLGFSCAIGGGSDLLRILPEDGVGIVSALEIGAQGLAD